MSLPPILLHRTARVAVRRSDGTLVTTEGKEQQILYVNQDGTIGGTGRVAAYLMQHETMSIRAEIIRFSTHPACNYVWRFKTDQWKLQVRFTSPWQPFAQLAWIPSLEEYRCTAWASFDRAPVGVAVRMGPSGRMVGRATIVAGWPFTCSIDIDHVIEDDMIAIFQPDDPTLAPVLSQVFRRPAAEWATQATQPMMCRIDQNSSLNRSLQHQTTTTVLDSSIDGDMSSVVDNGINTTNTVQPGSHTNHRSSDLFAFPSQFDQPDCNSRPYPPPYADSSNSASDLTLDTHSDELNAPFVTNSDLKTQETAVEDRCIVVIPLP